MPTLLELLDRARKVSEPFTDQFASTDPRDPRELPSAFEGMPWEVLSVASELTRDVPVSTLAKVCSAVSDLERQRRSLTDVPPAPAQWVLFDLLPSEMIGDDQGVPASVVWGAVALWKLTDFRSLLLRKGVTSTPPDAVQLAATKLMSAARACLRGQQAKVEEERKRADSERARRTVAIRHRKAEPHKAEAIQRAAKAHAAGDSKSKAAEDIMDTLMKGVDPRTGNSLYYRKETILEWLTQAGWTKDGWPNRPAFTS